MPYIKAHTHPREVFQILANAESEIEYWANIPKPSLPKYEKPVIQKEKVGWLNFTRDTLSNLKP